MRETLLIVDNKADLRNDLRRLFAGHYIVKFADSREAALRIALADAPDLILADTTTPVCGRAGITEGAPLT